MFRQKDDSKRPFVNFLYLWKVLKWPKSSFCYWLQPWLHIQLIFHKNILIFRIYKLSFLVFVVFLILFPFDNLFASPFPIFWYFVFSIATIRSFYPVYLSIIKSHLIEPISASKLVVENLLYEKSMAIIKIYECHIIRILKSFGWLVGCLFIIIAQP